MAAKGKAGVLKMKPLEAWAGELKSGTVIKTRKLKAMPKQVAASWRRVRIWRFMVRMAKGIKKVER